MPDRETILHCVAVGYGRHSAKIGDGQSSNRDEEIADVAYAAGRDAERERCGGLLDREASDADEKALVASAERRQVTANMLRGWHDQFARIAAAIRTGEQ